MAGIGGHGKNSRKPQAWMAAIISYLLTSVACGQCPPHYSVSIVQGPDCGSPFGLASVRGWGGNSNGAVCGDFACAGAYPSAFVARNGHTLVPLQLPAGSYYGQATAINDNNVVIGNFFNDTVPGYGFLGFVMGGQKLTTLYPLPGGTSVVPRAIDSASVVVGEWGNTGSGPYPLAFRWENGVMQD